MVFVDHRVQVLQIAVLIAGVDERHASVDQVTEELRGIAVEFLDHRHGGNALIVREPFRRKGGDDLTHSQHAVDFAGNVPPFVDGGQCDCGRGGEVGGTLSALGGGDVHAGIVTQGCGLSSTLQSFF